MKAVDDRYWQTQGMQYSDARSVGASLQPTIKGAYQKLAEYYEGIAGKDDNSSNRFMAGISSGILQGIGQAWGSWSGKNPANGLEVVGVEAMDGRFLTVVDIATAVLAGGTGGARTVGKPLLTETAETLAGQAGRVGGRVGVENVDLAATGIQWGKGIEGQGMPWENYLAKTMPEEARLPPNFKTFDFYDEATGLAISAKTLDTTTLSRMTNPRQIFTSIKGNIDAAFGFSEYKLGNVIIDQSMISRREVHLAVPKSTGSAQWDEIMKAVEYGKSKQITVKITTVE